MSQDDYFTKQVKKTYHLMQLILGVLLITIVLAGYYMLDPGFSLFLPGPEVVSAVSEEDSDKIEDGVHIRTGLIEAEGLMMVVNNCTNCHSAKILIQNRMNADRWNETIKWMQETQNLWDLGANQEVIVNYLVTNYPPKAKGRREILSDINWYVLED